MEMFNFVLDSFKRGIFDFKVKRQDLIAGTVFIYHQFYFYIMSSAKLSPWKNLPWQLLQLIALLLRKS